MKLNLQLKPKLSKPNGNFYSLIWLVLLLFMNNANAQIVQPFTTSTTWRCPSGVTSIQVECWGAGGAGGSASAASSSGNRSGGGGGAGSYVKKTITVVPGTDYTITVGQGGAIGGTDGASGYFGNPGGKSEFSGGSITALTASGGTGGTGAGINNINANPGGVLGGVYGFSVSGTASTLYTTSSAVTLTGGGGSGATAVSARLSGSTTYVATTNQGSGYTSAPTVSISIGAGQTFTAYVNPNINSTGDGITTILGSNGGASSSAAGGAGGASQAGIGGAGGVGTTLGGFTGANGTIVGSGGGGGFSYYATGTNKSATGGLGANGKIVLTYDAPTITYTYTGSGDLQNVANWKDELNASPANFTADLQIFKINNSVTTTAPWTVSGTGSKIVVGDSTHTGISVTIASGFAITAPMDVTNGNKVYVQGVSILTPEVLDTNGAVTTAATYTMDYPTFGTLGDTSEVHYQNSGIYSALVKSAFTYGKLYIDGTGTGTVFFSGLTLTTTNHIVETLFEVAENSKALFSEISYFYMTLNSGASANIYGTLKTGKVAGFVSSNVGTAASTFGSLQFIEAESLTLGSNSTIEYSRSGSATTQIITPRTDYKNLVLSGSNNNKSFAGATTVSGMLTVNITGTSTSTLAANLTVNGMLNFTAGKMTTASNTLTIGASGSITGAGTGWVIGNLKKLTASGISPSYTYAIGDATNYTPLALTFSGATSAAGGLTASTAAGDHASVASSGLNPLKSVNRTYTLTNDALAGFGTYNATFNYGSTDNDASATAASYVVRLYNGASWSEVSTSGTATTTATTVTGISSFGDFAIGELGIPPIYTYDGTGDLHDVSNWADELNNAPANFTASFQTFKINTSVTTTAPWTVSGTSSKVVVGDETHTGISLTIASGSGITATMDVTDGNKVYVQDVVLVAGSTTSYTMNFPNFGTLGDTSEVHYQNSGVNNALVKTPFTYGKLYIDGSGSGTVFFSGATNPTNHIVKTLFEVATDSKAYFSEISYYYMTLNSGASANIYGTLKCAKVAGFVSSSVGTASSTFGSLQFIGAQALTLGPNSTIEFNRASSGTTQTITPRTDYKNLVLSGLDNNKSFTGATTVSGNLTLNITGTSTSTLAANLTVNGVLNFTAGKITTASNTLTIGTSGSITGAGTGWVIGNLKKATALSGSPTFTYPIGDATNYMPLVLTFSGATSATGGLTAATTAGDHASIARTDLLSTKSVNRTWKLTNDALAGFGTYNATFNYASTDNDVDAVQANYAVRLYDGSSWSNVSISGTATTTATTATGISSFGDFAIGELGTAPIITYTYTGSGDLHNVSNWKDGLNVSPANFTADLQIFKINTSVTTTAPWTVSGTSKIVVGDNTHTGISLTIASGSGITATMDVTDGNKVYVQDLSIVSGSYYMNTPTFDTLGDTSEVHYQNSGVNNALVKTAFTYGKLYIDGTGTGTVYFSGLTNPTNHIVKTLFEVAAGSKAYFSEVSYYYMTLNSGASANIYGTLKSAKAAGFVSSSVGTASSAFGSLQFIGAEALTLGPDSTIEFNRASSGTTQIITPRTDYKNLILSGLSNNKSFTGATTVSGTLTLNITGTSTTTLGANLTVNGVLNFTAGKMTTASNTLTLGTSASITGAGAVTGWVIGNLKKATASSASPSFTYAIGDATNYTPLALTFSGGTSAAGGLTASTTAGDHAGITGSGLNASKSVNRTYTLTNDALAGFGTYNATFNYASTDNDSSTTAANYAVRLYDGSSWSNLSTSGTTTTTAATVTGISSFGDFAIGEIITGPSVANQSVCYGKTLADLLATGTAIKWYADATGGGALSPTTVLSTSATYYVSQTIDLYESERTAVEVTVSVQTAMPTLACFQSATWNTSTCAWDVTGTQPAAPTLVCYQTAEFNTAICDWVLIGSPTAAPTAQPQVFCSSLNATVANLVATGTALKWYAGATGATTLASNVALSSKTYYVSQTLNGCESIRTSVPVTFQTAPNAGTDGTLSLISSPSDSALFAALTGANAGGTWSHPVGGFTGVHTYTVQPNSPCSVADTATVTVSSSTQIPTSPVAYCDKILIGDVTAGTTLKFYKDATIATTVAAGDKVKATTYYVTETVNGDETPRVPIVVTLTALVAPTTIASTEAKVICKYMNTSNLVTFTTTPVVGASTYNWTVPSGALIVGNAIGASVTVSFEGVSGAPGLIGNVTVDSNNALGCPSGKPKVLALTTTIPKAPSKLVLTSAEASLSGLAAITKVGPYMGTEKVFTLTATDLSNTAHHYRWALPEGVNQLTGGTSNVITVDFSGVQPGIGGLPISVYSVGGCQESVVRTLTLGRELPKAPSKIVLTSPDTTPRIAGAAGTTGLVGLNTLTAITKVGPYMGTTTDFTLTATPVLTQGVEATSYAWVLPAGVEAVTTHTATTVTVASVVTDAIKTDESTITIRFSGSEVKTTGDLLLSVYAVNGAANSTAKTLKLARVVPAAPKALIITDDAISTETAVKKVDSYIKKETELTLRATAIIAQGTEQTSFKWVLPAGVVVNSTVDSTQVLDGITTVTTTSNILKVTLENVGEGVLSIPFNVYAVNGAGTSVTKLLTVTSAAPATPGTITLAVGGTPKFNPTCATSTTITVQVPPVAGLDYAWTVEGGITRIVSGNGTYSIVINVAGVATDKLSVSVVASNGTGPSAAKTLAIGKTTTCGTRMAPEDAAVVVEKFSAVAYPNPATEGFRVKSSNGKSFGVQVYDMLGRSIEQRQMNSDAPIGSNYAKGIYNVIVNQGAQVKTLRVIKQ